jgi:hypothetical protein
MTPKGLKQKDLIGILGAKSTVSEILNGKRSFVQPNPPNKKYMSAIVRVSLRLINTQRNLQIETRSKPSKRIKSWTSRNPVQDVRHFQADGILLFGEVRRANRCKRPRMSAVDNYVCHK